MTTAPAVTPAGGDFLVHAGRCDLANLKAMTSRRTAATARKLAADGYLVGNVHFGYALTPQGSAWLDALRIAGGAVETYTAAWHAPRGAEGDYAKTLGAARAMAEKCLKLLYAKMPRLAVTELAMKLASSTTTLPIAATAYDMSRS